MRRCPKCGGETADPRDRRCICGAVLDGFELPESAVEAKGVWGAPFGLKPSQPAVSVPRRFGVGTMMILTTMFAVLFGILKTAGVHPLLFAAISLFIGGVAVCQVLLYKGTNPRKASFIGGIITAGVVTVVVAAVLGFQYHSWTIAITTMFWGIVFLTPVLGGPLGYAAGCLVAAVFLVRKEPEDAETPPEENVE